MPLTGDYEPSTLDWARENAEEIMQSGGTKGMQMRGMPVILLTTVGAKTGKIRKTPLMRVEHDGQYAIVASLGGAPKNPVWYYNVKAHPELEIMFGPESHRYRARQVSDDEKRELWPHLLRLYPEFDEYQARTDRNIPVFRCERLVVGPFCSRV